MSDIEERTPTIIEHHAMLTIDEPCQLLELFDKQIDHIIIDLRGRTTTKKNKDINNVLGIFKLEHTVLSIRKDNIKITSKEELVELLDSYKKENIVNVYLVRLEVVWHNGDRQNWGRKVLYTTDKEQNREIKSGRMNALTIPTYTNEAVEELQSKYSSEMVRPTTCQIGYTERVSKRYCHGISPGA